MMRKPIFAFIGAAAIIAAACGGAAPAGAEVRVVMTDFKFDPNLIEVPAGRKVEFKLTNNGSVEHDITAKGIGFHILVPAAKRVSAESGPFTAGEYDIYCAVAGHKEVGMVGKIVVK